VKKKYVVGLGVTAVIVLGGVFLLRGRAPAGKYETATVDRGDIVEVVTATGTVNPVITVRVGSQVSGRIVKLFADFNSEVKEGQVIAQVDTDIYETRVAQARANHQMAKSQTLQAKVGLVDAERDLKRVERLAKDGVRSERDMEIAQAKFDAAKAEHAAALAREEQMKAALNSAEVDLEHTTIYSPVDGVVISRTCDVGQTVVASFQTPDLFLIAKDLTKMQVEAYVDEADIGKVRLAQKVTFTVDAFPNKTFTGTVSQIRFAPEEQENVVTYVTVVEVPNPDLILRPGMTATVSVFVEERDNALRVPDIAVRFKSDPQDKDMTMFRGGRGGEMRGGRNASARGPRPGMGGRPGASRRPGMSMGSPGQGGSPELTGKNAPPTPGSRLWILEPEGKPRPVRVTFGISDGRHTEIVEGGVREGQKVIVGYIPEWRKMAASGRSFLGRRGGPPGR
jgi:HlyD family secretion protein